MASGVAFAAYETLACQSVRASDSPLAWPGRSGRMTSKRIRHATRLANCRRCNNGRRPTLKSLQYRQPIFEFLALKGFCHADRYGFGLTRGGKRGERLRRRIDFRTGTTTETCRRHAKDQRAREQTN